ncbi:MAG TPA: threonine/serine dehydratase [Candidatus Bathyarchaeia archaeon]|nr:threonine/serine dehydratase [Candidatus Bathyarchaeia archaeon]
MTRETLPNIEEIRKAAKRISNVASRTPLVESPSLSKKFGRQIFLKLECFQPIRVFKIRGAYNKISQLTSKKVVAASSGNHGLAVAYSSRLLEKQCTVVIPETAVKVKADAIAENGAEVVKYGKYHSDREAKALEISKKTGAAFVHPFNDPDIIAGQGTCGLEICEQLSHFDSVIVPVGGGGLISGISIAVKSLRPTTKVFGVEPSGATKMAQSLDKGGIVKLDAPASVADGLIPSAVGTLTLEACHENVDGMFSVSDEEILSAMKTFVHEAHIFPEPSGSAPLAVLLDRTRVSKLGDRVVLVVSGGNVSLEQLKPLLS